MKKLTFETNFTTGGIEDLKVEGDENHFRWVRGTFGVLTGMNYLDKKDLGEGVSTLFYKYFNDLSVTVKREVVEDGVKETYEVRNDGKEPIDLSKDEYGIVLTFADGEDIPAVALKRRAYSRAIYSGSLFCVYNARVGGQTDGVGLVLTEGSLGAYSAVKYTKRGATEHTVKLPPVTLSLEESFTISWTLFHYENKEEFVSAVERISNKPFSFNDDELSAIRENLAKQKLDLLSTDEGFIFRPTAKKPSRDTCAHDNESESAENPHSTTRGSDLGLISAKNASRKKHSQKLKKISQEKVIAFYESRLSSNEPIDDIIPLVSAVQSCPIKK